MRGINPSTCFAVLLAHDCVRGPACDRRFSTIAREMILERVANAQGEADPDRYTEIKRHPGNLVLPVSKLVSHDPAGARVAETLDGSQTPAAIGNPSPP